MRTVVLYAALLGVAMVGSYLSWTAKDTGVVVAEEVPVYRASAGDVKALAFHSEDVDVRVERREDDRGAYAWIEVEERHLADVRKWLRAEVEPEARGSA